MDTIDMEQADVDADVIWFDGPAHEWTSALPVGNGRTAAMVFGDPLHERVQVNDATAWSGGVDSAEQAPQIDPDRSQAALAAAREAIEQGRQSAADPWLQQLQHRYSQAYLPFADLWVTYQPTGEADPAAPPTVSGYRRSLDLRSATHLTSWKTNRSSVAVRTWTARTPGVLVLDITVDGDPLDIGVRLSSPLRATPVGADPDGPAAQLTLALQLPSDVAPAHDDIDPPVTYDPATDALRGAVHAAIEADGRVATDDGSVCGQGVTRLRVVLATATTFAGLGGAPVGDAATAIEAARAAVDDARRLHPSDLYAQHLRDHQRLYDRCHLTTGAAPDQPIDRRLGNSIDTDPALIGLLFNYGRYLLICSSRPGGPPANLQGIWNEELPAPWSSNYTTNINLQMNYWPAQVTDLAECAEPLHDLVHALSRTGRSTARDLYDCGGWVAHHNTDIWGYSRPVGLGTHSPQWAFWPLAGPWLVQHLWEHLEFGSAVDPSGFAESQVLPPLRGAAEFCLDWLRPQADGSLGTCPSTSPENVFVGDDGAVGTADRSSAMDLVLIRDTLEMLIQAADLVGSPDGPLVARARRALPSLPGPGIDHDGRISEWRAARPMPEPHHRHLSPLVFLYPGASSTPGLDRAAAALLDDRGDDSTGWSLVWKIALRARLHDPGAVDRLLRLVFRVVRPGGDPLRGGLYRNLFGAHPPFQIDGNLGFTAGLAECLLQSHRGVIEILPALPATLPNGSVRGLIARPGVRIDIVWRDGRAVTTRLAARRPEIAGTYAVVIDGTRREVDVPAEPGVTLAV